MNRNYPAIIISSQGEEWLDKGQMWMYKNNLEALDESIPNGSLVDILTAQGRYLGTGFLSKNNRIFSSVVALMREIASMELKAI